MKKFLPAPFTLYYVFVILVSLIANPLAELGALQASSDGSTFCPQFILLTLLYLVVMSLAVVGSSVCLLFKKTRKISLRVLGYSLGVICALFVGIAITRAIEHEAIVALAERSTPIVHACRQFVRDNHRPPDYLEELVPKYLREKPKTGVGSLPQYFVTSNTRGEWQISVPAFPEKDEFIYLPSEKYDGYVPLNYPGEKRGYTERIGHWGYFHCNNLTTLLGYLHLH